MNTGGKTGGTEKWLDGAERLWVKDGRMAPSFLVKSIWTFLYFLFLFL